MLNFGGVLAAWWWANTLAALGMSLSRNNTETGNPFENGDSNKESKMCRSKPGVAP